MRRFNKEDGYFLHSTISFSASDIGPSIIIAFIFLTIALSYHSIVSQFQPSHPRCRTAFAALADRPPRASRSPPRRRMLPAASALDVRRPPIPARAAARRALPLTRQRALARRAVPPASKCRLTETIAAARHAALLLTQPTAPVQPVPPRPMPPDARALLAPVFPNK